ncbi:MAG: GNAT family N-acetyltransferase [Bacilli bacterium]
MRRSRKGTTRAAGGRLGEVRQKPGRMRETNPIACAARPFSLARDGERVAKYHTELIVGQTELWKKALSTAHDPQETRRALKARQESAAFVRQLSALMSQGEGQALMFDTPDGQSVGYVFATEVVEPISAERTGVIGELYVEEALRGRGAGTQMLQAAEHWMAGRGIRTYQIFVTKTNVKAVELYQKHGYGVVDYRMIKHT